MTKWRRHKSLEAKAIKLLMRLEKTGELEELEKMDELEFLGKTEERSYGRLKRQMTWRR